RRTVSRRICTPVLRGREVSSQKDLLLPSRLQLPSRRRPLLHRRQPPTPPHPQTRARPLLHRRQQANLPRLQSLRLLLPTTHRLLLQPWCLSQQTHRANSRYISRLWKIMSDFRQSNYPHVWNDRSRSRRIVERDRLDEENRLLDRTFWK